MTPLDNNDAGGCGTCRANRGELRTPGGVIYEDQLWRVEHKLEPLQIAGWPVAKPLRHVTAFAELTEDEAAAFGPLMRRVMSALTKVVSPAKVYLCLLAEQKGFDHVHFHVIPRAPDLPERFHGMAILHYDASPTWTEAETVAQKVQRRLDPGVDSS